MLGLIVLVILLTSAGVIAAGEGEPAFSAAGMAEQLEPLAGPAAFYLFTIGFFFAALSSLVVNALIGATLLVDGFGREASMDSNRVKYWAMAAMAIGTGSILVSGGAGDPIELLWATQALTVVAELERRQLVVLVPSVDLAARAIPRTGTAPVEPSPETGPRGIPIRRPRLSIERREVTTLLASISSLNS